MQSRLLSRDDESTALEPKTSLWHTNVLGALLLKLFYQEGPLNYPLPVDYLQLYAFVLLSLMT